MAAVLAESPVGVALSATGRFEVGYVTGDGAEHRVRLDEAWLVPLERALPVRRFGARKGQRQLSGLWWSATTGGHVGLESWLERDHLVALDYVSCAGMEGWPFVKSAGTAAPRRRAARHGAGAGAHRARPGPAVVRPRRGGKFTR
jgi:hypothetical protein